MKHVLLIMLFSIFAISVSSQNTNLHNFKVTDIDGAEFDFASLKEKKVLVVNVASKCNLTPQYNQLQELYEKYKDNNFVIVGFPANNFHGAEPGTSEDIKTFCTLNYNVNFPMMAKVDVVGENKTPIYKWLTEKSENGKFDAEVKWNFQKFMVDENGNLIDYVSPKESPLCDKIINWITE